MEISKERMRRIAKYGIFGLMDTNKGWEILLSDGKHKGKVYITEGWESIDDELIGKRLIIRGTEPFKSKVFSLLSFLERDVKWKDTLVCWSGTNEVLDLLILKLLPVYEILNVRKK